MVGRAVLSAPRASKDVRSVRDWATSDGALRTARPTFSYASHLCNTRLRDPAVGATVR